MSMSFSQILDGLNQSQKDAVLTTAGPLLISAGPGTGKTLTIVRRIAHLISKGTQPCNILAVTFTNRAALEMRERTAALMGGYADGLFIGTFHLLGLRILQDECHESFVICDREEQLGLLKAVLGEAGSGVPRDTGRASLRKIVERISRIKNLAAEVDDDTREVYEAYEAELAARHALDFDDLILRTIRVLEDEAIAAKYRNAFLHIMVDEYQDINPAQYRLLKLLSRNGGNLCVIGDADQAIYSFRGADPENFLDFARDYDSAKMIALTESYRSSGMILEASDYLIRSNEKRLNKELRPVRERGASVKVISVPNEGAEGDVIVREIETGMGGTSRYQHYIKGTLPERESSGEGEEAAGPYSFSDFCVIFRTNAQAKIIEESFAASGIPCQVIGGRYKARRKGLEDLLAVLRAIAGSGDEPALPRSHRLKGAEMARAIERLRLVKETLSLPELLGEALQEPAIRRHCMQEEVIPFLEELSLQHPGINAADAIGKFINGLRLLTPADDFDPRAGSVTLMTLHMAKGLEFRNVFITGVEEGLMPYTMRGEGGDIEEERRLFYVGMTRAMDRLFLLHARSRFIYGESLVQQPSRFLGEIPREVMEQRFVPDRTRKARGGGQMGLF